MGIYASLAEIYKFDGRISREQYIFNQQKCCQSHTCINTFPFGKSPPGAWRHAQLLGENRHSVCEGTHRGGEEGKQPCTLQETRLVTKVQRET